MPPPPGSLPAAPGRATPERVPCLRARHGASTQEALALRPLDEAGRPRASPGCSPGPGDRPDGWPCETTGLTSPVTLGARTRKSATSSMSSGSVSRRRPLRRESNYEGAEGGRGRSVTGRPAGGTGAPSALRALAEGGRAPPRPRERHGTVPRWAPNGAAPSPFPGTVKRSAPKMNTLPRASRDWPPEGPASESHQGLGADAAPSASGHSPERPLRGRGGPRRRLVGALGCRLPRCPGAGGGASVTGCSWVRGSLSRTEQTARLETDSFRENHFPRIAVTCRRGRGVRPAISSPWSETAFGRGSGRWPRDSRQR